MTEAGMKQALNGIKVVDASRVLAGPLCGQILGDQGADVIKVEPPQGDDTRGWGPAVHEGAAAYYHGLNRNKRGIALDLRRDAGRAVLLRLLDGADVFIENFKTGTLESWGLDYETVLKPRFPRLIYCRISGFGDAGPLGGLPGYDAVAQAMTGLMSINGAPESGATRMGSPVVDLGTGMNAAIGVLTALVERSVSGLGQQVDVSLYDSGIALMHPFHVNYLLGGELPGLLGNAHPNITPYDRFITATGEIFLAVGNDRQFEKFCAHIGCPELAADPRYASNQLRNENRAALAPVLSEVLARLDGRTLCEELMEIGVPAGPVQDVAQVFDHPQTAHQAMKQDVEGLTLPGVPVKLARTPGSVRCAPPAFGAHSREILAEAGYSEAEIASLISEGDVSAP